MLNWRKSSIAVLSIAALTTLGTVPAAAPVLAETAKPKAVLGFGTLREMVSYNTVEWDGRKINTSLLQRYYRQNRYSSIWTSFTGSLNRNGKKLLNILQNARSEGLDPRDYLSDKEKKLVKLDRRESVYAEVFLSQAFIAYARDVHMGRAANRIKSKDIVISNKKLDVENWLTLARKKGPDHALATLRPQYPQYNRLRKVLAKTNNVAQQKLIATNLERWRWLPNNPGPNYVLVNQPAFTMYTYHGGKRIDKRKVIVGDVKHPTPVFSHRIQMVQFNPEWNVPKSIAGKEFLPKLIGNANYLKKNGYRLHDGWANNAPEIDPRKVNWSKVNKENFPYRIVQGPSGDNALGQVKFLFPNNFDIYLHDTPYRKLFDKSDRALSHGCIRVNQPLEFAKILFSLDPTVGKVNIQGELAKEGVQEIRLNKNGIPIFLTYFTAWVGRSGNLETYSDIYNRDATVAAKL